MGEPEPEVAEILEAVRRADRVAALRLAVAAVERGVEHPLALMLAAEHHEAEGQPEPALALLARATAIEPDEPELWRRQARLLARQERLEEALAAAEEALDIDPDDGATLILAGSLAYRSGDLATAHDRYSRAESLAPDDPEPPAALAMIAARRTETAAARAFAERALAIRPDLPAAHLALARAELQERAGEAALLRMRGLLDRPDLDATTTINALDLRAEAFDALGRPAEAFADYERRNTLEERTGPPPQERWVDQAGRLDRFFREAAPQSCDGSERDDAEGARAARGHVFLLGFPRSGTTLLEKALAGHPDILTLEEVDCLRAVGGRFLADDTMLANLRALTPEEVQPLRAAYWADVRETLGSVEGKIVVDKLPLHTLAMPLIARLFPQARILFALRDPRDVVLSCFRRRFRLNAAMYEFLSLPRAARFYDAVMSLARTYREVLPLNLREVRHEALVADFEREMGEVLTFLGASWRAEVRDFAQRGAASLRTPSDAQLTRGLTTEGVGQWRRYEAQLAPVMDVLQLWAKAFGYAV